MRCDPMPGTPDTATMQGCLCDGAQGWLADQREAWANAPVDEGVDDEEDEAWDADLLAYDPDKHTSSDDEDVPVYANDNRDEGGLGLDSWLAG